MGEPATIDFNSSMGVVKGGVSGLPPPPTCMPLLTVLGGGGGGGRSTWSIETWIPFSSRVRVRMISSRSSFSLLTTSFTFSPRVLGEKILLLLLSFLPLPPTSDSFT